MADPTLIDEQVNFVAAFTDVSPLVVPALSGVAVGNFMFADAEMRFAGDLITPDAADNWIELDQQANSTNLQTGIWYKIAEAADAAGKTYTFNTTRTTGTVVAAASVSAFNNVDQVTPLDVPYNSGLYYIEANGDRTPPSADITTVTDGALIIQSLNTRTALSVITPVVTTPGVGFSIFSAYLPPVTAATIILNVASKIKVTAGLDSPGDWTYQDGTGGDYSNTSSYILALRPGVGPGPGAPVLSNATLPVYTP